MICSYYEKKIKIERKINIATLSLFEMNAYPLQCRVKWKFIFLILTCLQVQYINCH